MVALVVGVVVVAVEPAARVGTGAEAALGELARDAVRVPRRDAERDVVDHGAPGRRRHRLAAAASRRIRARADDAARAADDRVPEFADLALVLAPLVTIRLPSQERLIERRAL